MVLLGFVLFLSFAIIYLPPQMCVLEKVAGLRASVLTERKDSGITVAVSVECGAPVQLLFTVMKQKSSFSETREMNTRMGIFHLGHRKEGKENGEMLRDQNVVNWSLYRSFIFLSILYICM